MTAKKRIACTCQNPQQLGASEGIKHDGTERDYDSAAEAGWRMGHRFGVVGGTDHHGAYPGSYGDGRMGVFAEELTRQSLWEAFCRDGRRH